MNKINKSCNDHYQLALPKINHHSIQIFYSYQRLLILLIKKADIDMVHYFYSYCDLDIENDKCTMAITFCFKTETDATLAKSIFSSDESMHV